MKKIFLLATAAFLFSGVSFAEVNKGKKKKGKKGCCSKTSKTSKSCNKDKSTTVQL